MDSVLEGLNPEGRLPFEDAPSPEIYTSIFRGLWGVNGGETIQELEERGIVEDNLVSEETHNEKRREDGGNEDILEEEEMCGGKTPHENREEEGREDISVGAGCGGATSHGPLTPETTSDENGDRENGREDILAGVGCGGVTSLGPLTPETTSKENGEREKGREDILTGAGCGSTTLRGPLTPETTVKKNGKSDGKTSTVVQLRPASTSTSPPREHEMTATKPDMLPLAGDWAPDGNWTFELNFGIGLDKGMLTDTDTITLVASEETMCCRPWRPGKGDTLEEHEIGPGPTLNPGPPFAVGDIIMCNIQGRKFSPDPLRLQRGFILKADHPRYWIKLEDGGTVWTHVGKSWLTPRWAPGQFATDQDDPFANEKGNKSMKLGSYGIHVNAQLDSIRKIQEAKEFAKAVKADDAEIPVYLWNDRVNSPGITQER